MRMLCWTPYKTNTYLKHYTYVMLNTLQYKHISQTLYVCYVEHRTLQTHISNTMRMLCWTPYNTNTYLKHYTYVMLNTLQYKQISKTLYVCYVEHRTIQTHMSNTIRMLCWTPYNMKGYEYKHKARKQYTAMVLYLCNIESLPV